MTHMNLPDAYPELIVAQQSQMRRRRDLAAARRLARRDRVRSWLRRGYAAGEEVR
jgi:hypothetical protein